MNPLRHTTFAALLLALALPSTAAIAPGSSGNGELFLNVYDPTAKVSFAYDIGIRMGETVPVNGIATAQDGFFVQGQLDGGSQTFWNVSRNGTADNTIFTKFLSLVSASNLFWSVVAIDSAGSTATVGDFRLFTTVKQGDESKIAATTNAQLSTGIGPTIAGNFFSTVNSTSLFNLGQSTHATSDGASASDYSVNGSSYSLASDPGNAYYGKTAGLTHNYNSNTKFSAVNAVGASSWFYYLTRSSGASGGAVLVDEFDNGDGVNAGSGHDGYWGFTLVNDSTSRYNNSYLLSWTLEPRVYTFVAPTISQREFAAGIGRTEFTSAARVERLNGMAAAAALESSAGWVMPLGAAGEAAGPWLAARAVSSVPEPASGLLLAAGAALLWAGQRSRRPRPGAA